MQRALELAALGARSTQPNPRVGCVIAQGETIIGEGWHVRAGEPHAEVFALRAAGERARGATAFVTLEPCNHHGRTPPCTEALIGAGVARVIFANGDPNPEVDGRGIARLREAGIAVEMGLLAEAGEELNLGFFSRMRRARPWLRVKVAASLDARTALANGESRWITSEAARADVQQWRAESAAILSSSATVLADDPALTVREGDASRQPLRVILDRLGRVPSQARVFSGPGEAVRLTSAHGEIDTNSATQPVANADIGSRGRVRRVNLPLGSSGRLSLPAVLAWMGTERLNEVWTEAGPTLAGALVTEQLVDELVVYLAPRLLGPDARPLLALPPLGRLADSSAWRVCDLRQIGPDIRIILRPTH